MDILDSDYFDTSKKLAVCMGLWPYDTRKKYFTGGFWMAVGILSTLPCIIGAKVHFSDVDKVIEHFLILLMLIATLFKFCLLLISKGKLKATCRGIIKNWEIIIDPKEKKILSECSLLSSKIVNAYCALLVSGVIVMILPPLIPVLVNNISPSTKKLPYIYLFNGEFLVDDRDAHFWTIYFCDVLMILFIMMVVISVDSMYIVSVEHCVGVFTVINYRLQSPGKLVGNNLVGKDADTYSYVLEIIELHKRALKFAGRLEATYSMGFLIILFLEFTNIPAACYLIISNLENPVACCRFVITFNCLMVHYFALCVPAQRLMDASSQIASEAFCSEWYESSSRTKKLLWLLILRSQTPCILTAGGLTTMGLENYMTVQKTALSYVTFLCSFKYT